MRQYEMMVILDPEVEERTVQPSLEKYLTVITNDKGTVDKLDIWGRRQLAYPIKKKADGIYAVVNFTSESATAKELEHNSLNESILDREPASGRPLRPLSFCLSPKHIRNQGNSHGRRHSNHRGWKPHRATPNCDSSSPVRP